MGFFSRLFQNGKKNTLDNYSVFNSANNSKTSVPAWEDWSLKRSRSDLILQLRSIFCQSFPDYEFVCNLSAHELDAYCHPACTPIDFMFMKNGKPVLAVVVVRQNTYRGMNVIGTKKICENLGIRYIRFFEEYPNHEEYVVSRLRKYL